MKIKLRSLIFLLIPLIFLSTCLTLKDIQGPYFTNYKYDPSYVYLISSLNLSQFSSIKHVDHPGTPLQVIGAVVINISYFFNKHYNSLAEDVLKDPEKYLDKINFTLLILNCIGLFVLGLISYNIYSDVLLSLLLQLIPFTSINILNSLTLVRTENFLFFVICIFITGLLSVFNDKDLHNKKYPGSLIFLGIVSGLGLATKLTFFPLILIPLIFCRGIRSKLLFLGSTFLSFILFVLPVLSLDNIKYFINWIYKLFINSAIYGRGKPTIIDPNSFLQNLSKIVTNEWIFDLAYLSVFIAIVLWLKTNKKKSLSNPENGLIKCNFKLALGIFSAMTLQILIVSKHYAPHYMFPSLMLSTLTIFISVYLMSFLNLEKFTKRRLKIVYIIALISISLYGMISINNFANQLRSTSEETEKLLSYLDKNSENATVVSTKLASSKQTALFAAVTYAKNEVMNYKQILFPVYPKSIIFSDNRCYSFGDDDRLGNIFGPSEKILFVSTDENSVNQFTEQLQTIYRLENVSYEKKFSNINGEMVYEINFTHSF